MTLGCTLAEIDRTPFVDVIAWRRYFAEELAPAQRIEALLGQIAMLFWNAHCGAGREKDLRAFLTLLDPAPSAEASARSAIGRELTDPAEMEAVCRVLFGGRKREGD